MAEGDQRFCFRGLDGGQDEFVVGAQIPVHENGRTSGHSYGGASGGVVVHVESSYRHRHAQQRICGDQRCSCTPTIQETSLLS